MSFELIIAVLCLLGAVWILRNTWRSFQSGSMVVEPGEGGGSSESRKISRKGQPIIFWFNITFSIFVTVLLICIAINVIVHQ